MWSPGKSRKEEEGGAGMMLSFPRRGRGLGMAMGPGGLRGRERGCPDTAAQQGGKDEAAAYMERVEQSQAAAEWGAQGGPHWALHPLHNAEAPGSVCQGRVCQGWI